jgi:hypothetical protein
MSRHWDGSHQLQVDGHSGGHKEFRLIGFFLCFIGQTSVQFVHLSRSFPRATTMVATPFPIILMSEPASERKAKRTEKNRT